MHASQKTVARPNLIAGILACCAGLAAPPSLAEAKTSKAGAKDYALTVYGGRLTDGDWHESFGPGTNYIDSDLVVAALAKTLSRSADGGRSYEVEGQIAKHSGIQDNLEYNLLGAVRWHDLFWSDKLNSSAAIGLGVSYASSVPRAEATIINSGSEKLLTYWHLELTMGPPKSDWQASLRMHHRSTAYGLFGSHGGSNAVTLGVRYEFD
ncbi:MAG: hypothetical protein Q8M09_01235 [Pseudomonadota bacterium]|nr:hypothetical protein [Pseudomonadota bacterium]MDP1902868.1 hypothetical protein [Pseudomonadota bacterium]MDP2352153.1 hypothetical protein [Pseudomonadota bacterium]